MQRQILIVALLFGSLSAFAQLPNGGFELWEPNPNGANEIPTGWYGNSTTAQTVAKDTLAFAGEYALRVMSRTQGFEGWLPGYISTKVAAASNVGVLTCMISVDTMEHYDVDTSFAIIRIDTTEEFLWTNDTAGAFGFYAAHESTPGYVSISVPFELPPSVDTFYVHIVAHNVLTPLFSDGYVSMRVDQAFLLFEPNGLVESKRESALNVYPNPASETLFVRGSYNGTRFEIFDLSGRLLSDGVYKNKGIDVSNLPDGKHVLRLTAANGETFASFFDRINR